MSEEKVYTNDDIRQRVRQETGIRIIDLGKSDKKTMTTEEFEQRSAKLKRMVTLAFEDVDRQNRGVMNARNQSRQKDHK